MKNVFRRVGKFFFYLSYPVLVVALIVSTTLLIIKAREVDSLNATFAEATTELNQENQDRQLTIESLKQQFNDLTDQVGKLRAENTTLKQSLEKLQQEGTGTISGKIFPVVAADGQGFSQYQRVCAESVSNTNIQVCRTVPTIQQTFSLNVPVGTYKVYAEVFPQPATGKSLAGVKAYYTEYAKCLADGDATKCNRDQQKGSINVEVKAGATFSNADAIDWRI